MNPPVSPLLRVEHLALRVRDLEESVAWYRDMVGLTEVTRTGDRVYLAVGDKPTWDVSLVEGGSGLEYFSGLINDEETMDELADRLRAAGVEVTPLSSLDPQILAGIEFPLPGGQRLRAVVPAARVNYTVATQKHFAAYHAPKELHHVNLAVSDIPALERFLVDHLDMGISDHVMLTPEGPLGLAFWRFAENHHDIGAIGTPTDGLHHFAFSMSGVGHLVALNDRFAAHGFPIAENGIGRHGAGNNIFLYVRDPTGNVVEFSADIARITDRGAPHRTWLKPDRAGNAWGDIQPAEGFLQIVT